MSLYQTICAVEEIHKSSQLFKCANSTSRKTCTKNKQTIQTRATISLVVGLCNLCRLLHDGGTKMPNSRLLLYSAFLTLLRRDLCSSRSPAHKRWNPNLALDGVASPISSELQNVIAVWKTDPSHQQQQHRPAREATDPDMETTHTHLNFKI